MKYFKLFLIALLTIGCAKKEVSIPVIGEPGIQELHNHSQLWVFFEIENNDTIAKLNKNNTIGSTHWIYNIDRRLPLNKIVATITEMQDKHQKPSAHSDKKMNDYFSYADTVNKKLSFLRFDQTSFVKDSLLSKDQIKLNSKDFDQFYNINLTFNPKNIWINDSKIEKNEFKSTLLEFIDFSSEDTPTLLHLNFNDDLTFQEYLFYKAQLLNLQSDKIIIHFKEYIFDKNKVPDCGCE